MTHPTNQRSLASLSIGSRRVRAREKDRVRGRLTILPFFFPSDFKSILPEHPHNPPTQKYPRLERSQGLETRFFVPCPIPHAGTGCQKSGEYQYNQLFLSIYRKHWKAPTKMLRSKKKEQT